MKTTGKEFHALLTLVIGGCLFVATVRGISIDSQLTIVKSDCYERLAIGQRIHKKDVFRNPNARTFTECQMECTSDGEKCRSFSYGVGVKGNTTCELSSNMIKETVYQKPLGTTDDTDYDLYVKKMGCDLGLDIHPSIEGLVTDAPITGGYLPEEHPQEIHGYASSVIPLPFNADYKTKRRPESYKKQKEYPVIEHRQDTNHKSDKDDYDQSSFDNDYLGAVSYNRYPEKPDEKENEYGSDSLKGYDSENNPNSGLYKKKVAYDYIGSNGPPRGYGYSNNPVKKPKPIPIEGNYDYKPQKPIYADDSHRPSSSSASNGYDYQKPPFRPSHLDSPYNDHQNHRPTRPDDSHGYGGKPLHDEPNYYPNHRPVRPHNGDSYGSKPENNGYNYKKPSSNQDGYSVSSHDPDDPNNYPERPAKPFEDKPRPLYQYGHQHDSSNSGYGSSQYGKPYGYPSQSGFKPVTEHNNDYGSDEYPKRPNFGFLGGVYQIVDGEYKPYGNGGNYLPSVYGPKYPHRKPMLEDEFGPYGDMVTSVITQVKDVCFRRALAGKRISRAFVRKAVSCERVEDCQQECSDEKRFVCEGFNYRLDPTGRTRGDCELLDIPFDLLDIHRDVIPNPNYDYYEKDRNSFRRCKDNGPPPRPLAPSRPYHNSDRDRLPPPSYHGVDYYAHYGTEDRYRDTHRYDNHDYPERPRPGYGLPPLDDYRPFNRRSDVHGGSFQAHDKPYPPSPNVDDHGYQYLPPRPQLDHHKPPPATYLPPSNGLEYDLPTKHPNTGGYGLVVKVPSYHGHSYDNEVPLPVDGHKIWGAYGGSYGTGGYHKTGQDYWELNKDGFNGYDVGPPAVKPTITDHYLPLPPKPRGDGYGYGYGYKHGPLPLDECSLRTATGYRLYRKIVKKIISVPTIIDCESACFRETEFPCTSYAFRYIIGSDIPPNNCYLSDRNYKELDYYTDLEQDRNFDIYTMNNKERCGGLVPHQRDSSECFLHVRSGQRLDESCVRQSFFAKSFVDCELECLRSDRFICRTFTFRYGSAIIGGIAENCQLSDVPFKELDPHKDLVPDPGFVLYERASYGYGCELDHVNRGYNPKQSITSEADKVCYVGYGWPARLLPQAIRKVLRVRSEEECKAECTRHRMESPFCCMSFSFKSMGINEEPNCYLSDVFQRDLLETIDYVRDPDYWLFSWDNTNPECRFPDYYEQRVPFENRNAIAPGFAIWRLYSVGGWPCKRGTLCKQSEVGFWFCELEGGSPSSWDYCCRPRHQCGYSEGFQYQWCYVGHSSTQWRKCNDKYYPYLPAPQLPDYQFPPTKPSATYTPYIPSSTPDFQTKPPTLQTDYHTNTPTATSGHVPTPSIFVEQPKRTYLPPVSHREPRPWQTLGRPLSSIRDQHRPGFRPNRPKAPPPDIPPKPSLDEYEEQFDNLFLDPPRPGGFGQPRHWPISYLHKETPPNASAPVEPMKFEQMKQGKESRVEPKYEAIENLIKIIKSNDLNNIKYQITNESNKEDDILHVQIPLPTNLTSKLEKKSEKVERPVLLPPRIDDKIDKSNNKTSPAEDTAKEERISSRSLPVYRRSYIEKTNITDLRQLKSPEKRFSA